jgi:SAM-dependent methyltransferase
MTDYAEYFEYLKTRSVFGHIYRSYWLYPRLSRLMKGRVLDVGSGMGDLLVFRPGTVGADVNPYVVKWSRQRGLDVRQIDDGKLPFPNKSYEVCVLDNVLEHISDPTELLAEVRRVLVPGAVFIVGVPGKKGFASDSDHKVYYDKSTLFECLKKAGFLPEKFFWMPLQLHWLETRLSQYCLYGIFRVPPDR